MAIGVQGQVREGPSGPGLPGVRVSNGEHIVETDADGRYALEVEPGEHRFVFLAVPDGHRPSHGFYQSTHGCTEPREGVDFELEPDPDRRNRTFALAHISDTHVTVEGALTSGDVLAQHVQDLAKESTPDLIVTTGDMTDWGGVAQLECVRDAFETVPVPVYVLFGGHDGNEERHGGVSADEIARMKDTPNNPELIDLVSKNRDKACTLNFESVLGPTYYSFDRGGRHFVIYPNEDGYYSPEGRERKQTWLWADLALQSDDREIVMAVHGPPAPAFLDRLSRYNVGLILFGHWHSSKVYGHGKTVLAVAPSFCFGGIDTSPRGYRLVRFGDDGLEVAFKASQKTASSPETPARILLGGSGEMRLRWEQRLPMGLHRAAPVRAGDRILLSLGDDGYPPQGGIACVEAETGRLVWQTYTDASVKNSVAVSSSETTDDDDLCAAVSVAGRVYALSVPSGDVVWEADLPGYPGRWIYTSPAVADGHVYAGAKAGYGAYSLETGEQEWYTEIDHNDAWSCYASPQVYQELLVALVQRKAILALNRHTGEVVWERGVGAEFPYASPALIGRLVVTGGEAANLHFHTGDPGHLAVLDARSGDVVWDRSVLPSRYPTGLIAGGGRIYATTPDGVVLCCDLNTGDEVWRYETGDDLVDMVPYRRGVRSVLAAPVAYDGHIVVCGCDGYLYVLDAESGVCAGRGYLGSHVSAAPCLVGGGICLGTYDGRLLCYDI